MAKQRKKETERLYSDEISLSSQVELSEYVQFNLRKIADHRRLFKIPVIGIAGTEGKTTTKRMLSQDGQTKSILNVEENSIPSPSGQNTSPACGRNVKC